MDAIKDRGTYVLLDIEVSPNAAKFEIYGYNTWRETLLVKIKSPPTKGKANKELIKEFSHLTGSKVEIVAGLKSQKKTLKIKVKSREEILKIFRIKLKN